MGAIHWRAPTTMLGSFLLAVVFAIGHHVLYTSLEGKTVATDLTNVAGFQVSEQQIYTAAGTAFTFVVKAFLAFAVTVAYIQVLWRAVMKRTATVSAMDAFFDVLGNLAALGNVKVWWKYPLLFTLALSLWLLPVATVIPPATLSVVSAPLFSYEQLNVPATAYESANLLGVVSSAQIGYFQAPFAPSAAVTRTAKASAAQGIVLPISGPGINTSWTYDFFGPSLQCSEVDPAFKVSVEANTAQSVVGSAYQYLSWFPDANGSMPLVNASRSEDLNIYLRNSSIGPLPNVDEDTDDSDTASFEGGVATLYLGSWPNSMGDAGINGPETNETAAVKAKIGYSADLSDSTLVSCQLWNKSYHTIFDYTNGEQRITVDQPASAAINQVKTIAAFTALPIENYADFQYTDCPILSIGPPQGSCEFDVHILQRLSYLAVMDAFGQLVRGSISQVTDVATTVHDTALIETAEELSWLSARLAGEDVVYCPQMPCSMPKLQQIFANSTNSNVSSLVYQDWNSPRMPLPQAVENMFENITLSLMSSKALQPNTSSIYAPPQTNVTFESYHNIYAYAPSKLWLAYGIAIGLAAINVAVGLVVIAFSRAAFSDRFSTILRATRYAEISPDVQMDDGGARDPLPRYLAQATLRFYTFGDTTERKGVSYESVPQGSNPKTAVMSADELSRDDNSRNSVARTRED